MKEVTYEEWQENPTPRMMRVWDDNEDTAVQRKVVFIKSGSTCPVMSITSDGLNVILFKHCAEIEKQRRMTNKELSRWLREKPTREYKYKKGGYILCSIDYTEENCNDEVEDILIRENDGEWREPLVEVEE